jgi:hypothetical protein
MYLQANPVEIEKPTHSNLIECSITAPNTCVIAQQYSSATVVSKRFHSCQETFGANLKNVFLLVSVL